MHYKWYEVVIAAIMAAVFGFLGYMIISVPTSGSSSEIATPADVSEGVFGFLTVDGEGLSAHPFETEADYMIEWAESKPAFTALPVWVTGDFEDTIIRNATALGYQYELGTSDKADAYYTVIAEGWQEGFEDLFVDIYDYLNSDIEIAIDGTILDTILTSIHGDTKYGYLQDIVTEALVLVRDIQDNGRHESYNERAKEIYNDFYSWLHEISIDEIL